MRTSDFLFPKRAFLSFAGLALMAAGLPADASNLITNGSFNTTSPVTGGFSIDNPNNPTNANNSGGADYLAGWTTNPSNGGGGNNLTCLIYNAAASGTAISGNNTNLCGSVAYGGGLSFPTTNGATNGPEKVLASPDGGNFIAVDSAAGYGSPLQQTVSGLSAGMTYALSFYQAATQQQGFSGATTDTWDVSLGSQTIDATTMSISTQGFSGWQQQTLIFTATAAQETLSFFAVGTPANNDPPFALLDGVSLSATPEPGTFGLLGLALLSVPALRNLRRKK